MKIKKLLFLAMLTLLSVLCVSCGGEDEYMMQLGWYPHMLTQDYKSGRQQVTINAGSKVIWKVFPKEPVDWCSASLLQGKGQQTFAFTFEANRTLEERIAFFYVQDINGESIESLQIIQDANPGQLEISPAFIHQDAPAVNCSINVLATTEWIVEDVKYIPADWWENYPWCTLNTSSGVGNSVIVASLKENPTETKRGAIITVRSGDVTKTYTIYQSAKTLSDEVGVEINGITWATRNVGVFGTFASNNFDDYGKYYQFNYPIGFPSSNSSYLMVNRPDQSGDFEFDWDLVNDPSPEGWRIPTIDEMDALCQSGYRWMDKDNSGYGCSGAWLGPNAANATKENPGKAVFFPAMGYFLNNALQPDYLDYGCYFVTGRVVSVLNQSLRFHKSSVGSPKNNGFGRNAATTLRCVKK